MFIEESYFEGGKKPVHVNIFLLKYFYTLIQINRIENIFYLTEFASEKKIISELKTWSIKKRELKVSTISKFLTTNCFLEVNWWQHYEKDCSHLLRRDALLNKHLTYGRYLKLSLLVTSLYLLLNRSGCISP